MEKVQNLIIDLGGVLYGIDPMQSVQAFSDLMGGGAQAAATVVDQMESNSIWKELERGNIGEGTFRTGIREALQIQAEDAAIDAAWNALLLGPLPKRLQLLQQLDHHYSLVLLSNTNSIHYRHLYPASEGILDCFAQLFLSFEMGKRKPEPGIYQQVLEVCNWAPESCLFIDDGSENVTAAKMLGMQAAQVEAPGKDGFPELVQKLLP